MDICPDCGKPVFRWQYAQNDRPLSDYCLGHLTITMHQASGTMWGMFKEPEFEPPESEPHEQQSFTGLHILRDLLFEPPQYEPYERVAVPQLFVDAFAQSEENYLCP